MPRCGKESRARGYCARHYSQWKRHGHAGGNLDKRSPRGSGHVAANGYRYVYVNGRRELEQRLVMEKKLGRPLYPDETVHHRNGVHHDNRPSNLRLRVRAHAKGLSVPEAVAWAREILDRYATA